jgi:hypothetical protein
MSDTSSTTPADAARARTADRVASALDRSLLAEARSTSSLRHVPTHGQPTAETHDLETNGVRRTIARGVIDEAIADTNGHRTRSNMR